MPETITSAQVAAACRVLGLDPDMTLQVTMNPAQVVVEYYALNEAGHKYATPPHGRPATEKAVYDVHWDDEETTDAH